jgi:hypothetical protein
VGRSLPVVRGDAAHEALVASLAQFLARHTYLGQAGPWVMCLCGWRHDTVTHPEHVAAMAAVERPWVLS